MRTATVRWTVLVPVKALPSAKSRLAGFSADADAHARLVHAIREDTLRAARDARDRWPDDGVAALVGDLPALTSAELGRTLAAAAEHETAFVPDAFGTGTTLLTARPPATLDPHFGPGSAARHGAHAAALPAGPGLRQDVDTADDLRAALLLGVGPRTLAALAAQSSAVHCHGAS